MDELDNNSEEFVHGRKTSGTRYLKVCKGCGDKFWGRENAEFHTVACRKHFDYTERKRRRASLDGADERLMQLVEAFEQLLPEGQRCLQLPVKQIEHLASLLSTYTGNYIDTKENKKYYVINSNFMWRKEADLFILRRKV